MLYARIERGFMREKKNLHMQRRFSLKTCHVIAPHPLQMTVMQFFTACPRFDPQEISSFGVFPFRTPSNAPDASGTLLIKNATSTRSLCKFMYRQRRGLISPCPAVFLNSKIIIALMHFPVNGMIAMIIYLKHLELHRFDRIDLIRHNTCLVM